jgi:hypothetical protein
VQWVHCADCRDKMSYCIYFLVGRCTAASGSRTDQIQWGTGREPSLERTNHIGANNDLEV